jgi:transcription initiation factor TFIIE subunit beta
MASSYLQKQREAFKESASNASSKLSNKRTVAVHSTAPTPRPSTPSSNSMNDLKRKRPDSSSTIVYSQPADTGTGRYIMTQVTYAVDYLKSKETPQSLASIIGYLSLQNQTPDSKRTIANILKNHDRVEFTPSSTSSKTSNAWEVGTYRFRPIHNIRSATELLAYLQAQPSAQGLSVKELKDGWSGAEEAIDSLESSSQLLVTRNKKDNHARMVWANDPSLSQSIDAEFQTRWHKIKIPGPGELPGELSKAGLKPTSVDPATVVKKVVPGKKERQKRARRGGRQTNTHMAGILRDYSSKK